MHEGALSMTTGRMDNKGRIGLDNAGYKELWNADHADDPLEI